MLHHERCEDREDDDHHIEQGDGTRLVEVVLAEKCQIQGEQPDEDKHVETLPDERRGYLCFGCIALLHGLLERVQYTVGLGIDDVATVDDALTFQHHARGLRNEAEHIVHLRLAAVLVVDEIGFDVFIQVALLQHRAFRSE